MDYFKKSINVLIKNFLIIIPLYISIAIPQLITGNSLNELLGQLPAMFQSMSGGGMQDPQEMASYFLNVLQRNLAAFSAASSLGLILTLLAGPITVGFIKKVLKGEDAGLLHIIDLLKNNFIRYLLWIVGCIILGVIVGVACALVFGILGLLTAAIGGVGLFLIVIIGLAAIVFGIYFGIRITLWLPAMIIDEAGIMEGLKKGFAASKGLFWTLFGITLLVGIASGILTFIFSFLGGIPVIGPLIMAAVVTLSGFILLAFYMVVYYEKVKGAAAPQES
jgi:hypothetical protein